MEITGKDTHIQRFVRCNKITAFWFPLKCQAAAAAFLQSKGLRLLENFLCKGKQAVQTLRRKAPDLGKCANGVQKVCSRFPT